MSNRGIDDNSGVAYLGRKQFLISTGNDGSLRDGDGVTGSTNIETSSAKVDLISTTGQSVAYENTGSFQLLIGSTSTTVSFGNPFAGSWNGPYTAEVSPPEDGVMSWTITLAGQIAGTGYNTSVGFEFSIMGAIDKNGNLSGSIDVGRSMGGTLSINPNGQMTGNVKSIYSDGSFYINECVFNRVS